MRAPSHAARRATPPSAHQGRDGGVLAFFSLSTFDYPTATLRVLKPLFNPLHAAPPVVSGLAAPVVRGQPATPPALKPAQAVTTSCLEGAEGLSAEIEPEGGGKKIKKIQPVQHPLLSPFRISSAPSTPPSVKPRKFYGSVVTLQTACKRAGCFIYI